MLSSTKFTIPFIFSMVISSKSSSSGSLNVHPLVGANRTGEDDYGHYPKGISCVFDNLGHPIHETRRDGLLYALLDKKELETGRKRFPAWQAADRWQIEL